MRDERRPRIETNEQKNLAMMSCQHDISWSRDKGARCFNCGGQFALILLPTIVKPPTYALDDDEPFENTRECI